MRYDTVGEPSVARDRFTDFRDHRLTSRQRRETVLSDSKPAGPMMSKLRCRPRSLMTAIVVETALFVCGLASSDCLIATIALWAACISWPLWLWRHPAFLLIWTYMAVTGYFLLLPWLVNAWMVAQHTFFGRTFC